MASSDSTFQTFVNLLYSAKGKNAYTLILGPGLSLTPALLHSRGYTSWYHFYKDIERFSQQECTNVLDAHFKTLQNQLHTDYEYLAQLIREGYFKAVFTTNIDTTLEYVLQAIKQVKILIRGTHT